jgi:AraC-like DNA-binding protein
MICREMRVSRTHLSQLFKQEIGMSIMQYVQHVRIGKAKLMLVESDDPISLISERCGIQDSRYFSRIFKKSVGLSPTVFRKRISGTGEAATVRFRQGRLFRGSQRMTDTEAGRRRPAGRGAVRETSRAARGES